MCLPCFAIRRIKLEFFSYICVPMFARELPKRMISCFGLTRDCKTDKGHLHTHVESQRRMSVCVSLMCTHFQSSPIHTFRCALVEIGRWRAKGTAKKIFMTPFMRGWRTMADRFELLLEWVFVGFSPTDDVRERNGSLR